MIPAKARLARLVLAAALAPGTVAAGTLFQPVAIDKARRSPAHLVSPLPVRVDAAALAATPVDGLIEAPLPDGRVARVRLSRLERHANGDISWFGKVEDPVRGDLAAVGTTGEAGTWAEIETPEATWGVVPSQEGHDWLFDRTASQGLLPLPQRADDFRVPPVREYGPVAKTVCPAVALKPVPQTTIDVLAVITPDFVATHGGPAGAETRLNNLFATMNAYHAASNVAITYRRVATMSAAYQAASTAGDDDAVALSAITNGTGPFAQVGAIRNFFGADMVAMFRGPKSAAGNSISGVAWLNGDGEGNMPAFDANYMYSVSGDWAFPGATLPAHELGHNLGNSHDRPNAGTGIGTTPYAYGHFVCGAGAPASCGQAGFNNTGTGFGTIMAYHRPTVARFSSPALVCQGTQPGAIASACGVAEQQDDVRAMNCIRQSVAAFRFSWVDACASLAADSDGDSLPDCLEAGSGRVNGAKDNDIFGNPLLFAAQQYRDFLAREPDADGLNHWTSVLAGEPGSRGRMVEAFFGSAEFQGTIAPVARLYFAYFLRIPDYDGLRHWIGQFKAGMSLGQVSASFAESPEFALRYGTLSNPEFVSLVYANVLGRAPDAVGLAYWNSQLESGAIDRGALMLAFSESPEYRTRIASETYVTMIYVGMLRRSPDPGGFAFWVGHDEGGGTGPGLIDGFLASAEYRNRFLP